MARAKKETALTPEERLQAALVPDWEWPYKLPENWCWTYFKSISTIQTGKKDANYGSDEGKYPFFTCAAESIRCHGYSFDCRAILLAGNGDINNISRYNGKFEAYQRTYVVKIAEPLLGEVGADETAINEDKAAVAEAITAEAVKTAGFDSLDAAKEEGTAFVFMGHGTSHTAKISYSQMQAQMEQLGYENVFIGTVEGEPEDTACEAVIEKLKNAGYKKVILRPLMVVAGDHANNDMAGDDDDSWKSQFEASGVFDSIDTQIAGLGEIDAIQQLYVAHTQAAIDAE